MTMPMPRPFLLVPERHVALHTVALEVEPGDEHDWITRRLAITAEHHGGIAIAAPQVGLAVRLVATADGLTRMANPTIVERSGVQVDVEGCLSYPGRYYRVERARTVTVEGIDPLDGRRQIAQCSDLLARMWQHELDHLDGLVLDGRFEEVTPPRTYASTLG